jgi:hypothetical protein
MKRIPIVVVLTAVAVFSASKGLNLGVQIWGQPYWLIDYGHGLIKRGLLGTVYSFLFDRSDFNRIWASVLALHLTACVILLVGMMVWVRERKPDSSLLACAFLFAASQFPPTLFYNTGYFDVYLYLLAAAAAFCAAQGRYLPAAIIGLVAPFIHESFIFVWAPIAFLLLLDDRPQWLRWAAIGAPALATVIIYFGHSQSAAVAEVMAAPQPDDVKLGVINWFGRHLIENLIRMAGRFAHYPINAVKSALFFALPAVTILSTYLRGRKIALRRLPHCRRQRFFSSHLTCLGSLSL